MNSIHEGQCGLCVHFGEHHADIPDLVEIRKHHLAPEHFLDDCGHPRHASLNLKVTPESSCDGFEPVIIEEE